jgi:hypothetical protein
MYIEEKQEKFIELRAQGWSFSHIASELYVSKRSLVEWSRLFADDIQAFRAAGRELLLEKVTASREDDLNRLLRFQKDVEDELASRQISTVPIEKLFKISSELRKEIRQVLLERDGPAQPPSAGADVTKPANEPAASATRTPTPPPGRFDPNLNGSVTPEGRESVLVQAAADTSQLTQELTGYQVEGSLVSNGATRGSHLASSQNGAPSPNGSTPHDGLTHPLTLHLKDRNLESLPPVLPEPIQDPALAPEAPGQSLAPSSLPPQSTAAPASSEVKTPPEPTNSVPIPQPPRPHPLEHCLNCGQELPPLLSNGQRPFTHCQNRLCGHPLPAPGTSLRETCYRCGIPLRIHGTNAERCYNTCPACSVNLPALDPKVPFPWLPPHQRSSLPKA